MDILNTNNFTNQENAQFIRLIQKRIILEYEPSLGLAELQIGILDDYRRILAHTYEKWNTPRQRDLFIQATHMLMLLSPRQKIRYYRRQLERIKLELKYLFNQAYLINNFARTYNNINNCQDDLDKLALKVDQAKQNIDLQIEQFEPFITSDALTMHPLRLPRVSFKDSIEQNPRCKRKRIAPPPSPYHTHY